MIPEIPLSILRTPEDNGTIELTKDRYVQAKNHQAIHHRYHYRIVLKQCATTIYDERSSDNTFRAVVDVIKGLQNVLTNVLFYRDLTMLDGCIVISVAEMSIVGDLEYATWRTDCRRHNVRTGMAFFVAAEIISNAYLFMTAASDSELFEELDVTLIRNQNVITTSVAVVKPTLPSAYNPLHDLESVWWITEAAYVLFFNDNQ
ncbi:hypothetical protein EV368DRAFT_68059 [Lentinula lateritia]|nr:hypothetical protein EV368DRAFT_68059 [Lentinula lateritia]